MHRHMHMYKVSLRVYYIECTRDSLHAVKWQITAVSNSLLPYMVRWLWDIKK